MTTGRINQITILKIISPSFLLYKIIKNLAKCNFLKKVRNSRPPYAVDEKSNTDFFSAELTN